MTHLRAFSTASGAVRESRVLAQAHGAVFVNPFVDDRNPAATSRLRAGRVIGGGVTTKPRQIRLVLRQPDYAMARMLQAAINDHFGNRPRVARAKNPSFLEIKIAPGSRADLGRPTTSPQENKAKFKNGMS